MHRGDAVEREESEPDASRVRLLAFFPSRATGSSGKEDDDVIRLSLSLSPALSFYLSPGFPRRLITTSRPAARPDTTRIPERNIPAL